MKRTGVALILALLVALIGTACGGGGDSSFTIHSADGRATLTIPEGALPDDFDRDTLAIVDRTAEAIDARQAAAERSAVDGVLLPLLGVYELRPDGLRLRQPVTFSLTLPLSDEAVFGFHVSDGVPEPITELELEVDPANGTVTLRTPIDHFSELRWLGIDFVMSVTVISDGFFVPIGGDVEATAITSRRSAQVNYPGPVGFYFGGVLQHFEIRLDLRTWKLRGEFRSGEEDTDADVFGPPPFNLTDVLTPNLVKNRPPLSLVNGPRFTANQTFTCAEPEHATILYIAEVQFEITLLRRAPRSAGSGPLPDPPGGHGFVKGEDQAICSAPPTPTPTSGTEPGTPTPGTSTGDPTIEVRVLVIDGQRFPMEQFSRAGSADPCRAPHYHASFTVFSLEGGSATDPDG